MKTEDILKCVDHTLLKADAQLSEIIKICEEAIEYKMASVCIPPSYISEIKSRYGDGLNVCTVIGFPLGYHNSLVKLTEIKQGMKDGGDEFDMVINIGDVKNKEFSKISREIELLKKEVGNKILKVIIETCYLTDEEKIMLCKIVTESGADFIKTSTGFGTAGANFKDIALFKEHIGDHVKIKAAGGIRSLEDMVKYLELGCERLGTSSALKLIGNNTIKESDY